jgi:shikimate dehydrogenase
VTRQVALIGKPLKRRHSQVMHDAAFDAAGIDGRYVLREIEADEVAGVVGDARGDGWLGLGVTAPYKQVVARLVDEVEGDARTIGAVNNVVRTDDGRLIGFNSDAPGFRAGVELAMGRPLDGVHVVVAGAGGAAHAVVFALLTGGAKRVTVAARTVYGARALVDRFGAVGKADRLVAGLGSDAFRDAIATADLAVNATTVGMIDAGMTIPVELLPGDATVFDLVYVPPQTPLLATARARGLKAANGSEMLIQQAAIAFQRWTGVDGMADVMRAAVMPLLDDPTVAA